MSEPTYRIELEHDAATPTQYKWNWYVWRISDCALVANGYTRTPDDGQVEALAAIKRLAQQQRGVQLFATEDGELCDAPEPQGMRVV